MKQDGRPPGSGSAKKTLQPASLAPSRTFFCLMGQYGSRAIIPVEHVCADYFAPLTLPEFMRKSTSGEIALPIVRLYAGSQKAARGVHIQDLAEYLDVRTEAARKELHQILGKWPVQG
jgi:hypothetical protein